MNKNLGIFRVKMTLQGLYHLNFKEFRYFCRFNYRNIYKWDKISISNVYIGVYSYNI